MRNCLGQNHDISDHRIKIKIKFQYFGKVDSILIEINQRFKQIELIETVETCNPNTKMLLDLNTIIKSSGISTDNQFLEKFEV